jgi:hypothetical protein
MRRTILLSLQGMLAAVALLCADAASAQSQPVTIEISLHCEEQNENGADEIYIPISLARNGGTKRSDILWRGDIYDDREPRGTGSLRLDVGEMKPGDIWVDVVHVMEKDGSDWQPGIEFAAEVAKHIGAAIATAYGNVGAAAAIEGTDVRGLVQKSCSLLGCVNTDDYIGSFGIALAYKDDGTLESYIAPLERCVYQGDGRLLLYGDGARYYPGVDINGVRVGQRHRFPAEPKRCATRMSLSVSHGSARYQDDTDLHFTATLSRADSQDPLRESYRVRFYVADAGSSNWREIGWADSRPGNPSTAVITGRISSELHLPPGRYQFRAVLENQQGSESGCAGGLLGSSAEWGPFEVTDRPQPVYLNSNPRLVAGWLAHAFSEAIGGIYFATGNRQVGVVSSATWEGTLPAGKRNYRVEVFIPRPRVGSLPRTDRAQYLIFSTGAGAQGTAAISQRVTTSGWMALGTFPFDGTYRIVLTDETGEPWLTRSVVANAVRLTEQ